MEENDVTIKENSGGVNMQETTSERANRIYGNWNYQDNVANEDVDWLIDEVKKVALYEEALKQCMTAIQKNLAYAQIKDEQVLYEAFMNAQKLININTKQ